jgi:hypothetical protein
VNKKTDSGQTYSVPRAVNELDIIVGTNLVSSALPSSSNMYKIKRVIVHKDYTGLKGGDSTLIRNDIALLETDAPIKFNKYVRALRIAPPYFNPMGKMKEFWNC